MSVLDTVIISQSSWQRNFSPSILDEPVVNAAGRKGWQWYWCGLGPPDCTAESYGGKKIDERFHKFKKCFGEFHGIGTLDYWRESELALLSNSDKLELIGICLEQKDNKRNRPYLGIIDGKINPNIPVHSDWWRWFKPLSYIECANKNPHPHNSRSRYLDGFFCYDCMTFIPKDSDEYLTEEYGPNICLHIHNIAVPFTVKNKPIPNSVIRLENMCKLVKEVSNAEKLQAYKLLIDAYEKVKKSLKTE